MNKQSATYSNHNISILICSKDRRSELENLVKSLKDIQIKKSFQIVVVEETDNPFPIHGVKYVSHPYANRGIPYARNMALRYAEGEIFVFVDDDCVLHNGWFEKLLQPLEDASVIGVQGGVTVPEGTNAVGWVESILGFPGGGIKRIFEAKGKNQDTREISTLNCAYRRWVIEKVGGFERELKVAGEDYILAKKACSYGRCLFIPNAVVFHYARGSLKKIWRWFIRRGRSEIDIIRVGKQRDTTFFTLLKSSLLIKFFFFLIIGVCFPRVMLPLMFLGLLAYVLLQYFRCYQPWKYSKAKKDAFIIIPVVKLVMDIAMDTGRFIGLIFDKNNQSNIKF